MTTTYLGLATVPTNSTNPSVPVNNAMAAFDAAIAGTATRNLVADANYTLLSADYLASVLIITDTGPVLTAGRDLIFPGAFSPKLFKNTTAKTITVKKSGQPGTAVAAAATVLVFSGATDVVVFAGGGGGAIPGGEQIAEPVTVLTPASGVVTIDCSLGHYFTLAPTANVTSIVFTNLPAAGKAQTIMVSFTQDSTARTVTWPASFKWAGGTAGAVSTGSGAIDVLALTTFNQGTTWNATLAKAFA
jgi:hypothetical protein